MDNRSFLGNHLPRYHRKVSKLPTINYDSVALCWLTSKLRYLLDGNLKALVASFEQLNFDSA